MGRPRPAFPTNGPFAYPISDDRRKKPSWFYLEGYFEKKGRGKRRPLPSSSSQQNVKSKSRGVKDEPKNV